jgi:hypothetical protein
MVYGVCGCIGVAHRWTLIPSRWETVHGVHAGRSLIHNITATPPKGKRMVVVWRSKCIADSRSQYQPIVSRVAVGSQDYEIQRV